MAHTELQRHGDPDPGIGQRIDIQTEARQEQVQIDGDRQRLHGHQEIQVERHLPRQGNQPDILEDIELAVGNSARAAGVLQPIQPSRAERIEKGLANQFRRQHIGQQGQVVSDLVADLIDEIDGVRQLPSHERQLLTEDRQVEQRVELGEYLLKSELEAVEVFRQVQRAD